MLRRKAWPYLLGLVEWTQDFEQLKNTFRAKYYSDVVEWEKIEKIVRERDQEAFAAGKCSFSWCLKLLLSSFKTIFNSWA